jgi:hypothetical protein
MRPSDEAVRTYVKRCPECRKEGWAVWYLPQIESDREHLQLVIHHGLGPRRGSARNDFHYFKHLRRASDDEILHSYRANPMRPPGDSIDYSNLVVDPRLH